jgi:hypothetical protein
MEKITTCSLSFPISIARFYRPVIYHASDDESGLIALSNAPKKSID